MDAASLQLSIGPVATGVGLLGFALALCAPGRRQALVVLPLLVLVPAVAETVVFTRALEKARGEKLVKKAIEAGSSAVEAFEKYGIM